MREQQFSQKVYINRQETSPHTCSTTPILGAKPICEAKSTVFGIPLALYWVVSFDSDSCMPESHVNPCCSQFAKPVLGQLQIHALPQGVFWQPLTSRLS